MRNSHLTLPTCVLWLVLCLILTACAGRPTLEDAEQQDDTGQLTKREVKLRDTLDRALAAPRSRWNEKIYAQLIEIGLINNIFNRFTSAELAFRRAIQVREKLSGLDDPLIVEPMMDLSVVLAGLGRFDEAIELLHRATVKAQESQLQSLIGRAETYRAVLLLALGEVETGYQQSREASGFLRDMMLALQTDFTSGTVASGIDFGTLMGDLAQALYVQAVAAFRTSHFEESLLMANLARRVTADVPEAPNWWLSRIDELLAEIEAHNLQIQSAVDRMRVAAATTDRNFKRTIPLARSLMGLGRIRRLGSRYRPALQVMLRGLSIVSARLNEGGALSADRLYDFLATSSALLSSAETPEQRRQLETDIFQSFQLLRGPSLTKAVNRMKESTDDGKDGLGDLISQLTEARRNRDILWLELSEPESEEPDQKSQKQSTRDRYNQARKEIEEISQRVNELRPGAAELVAPKLSELDDITALLQPDEALITFLVAREGGYILVLRPDGMRLAPIRHDIVSLTQAIKKLRGAFAIVDGAIGRFDMDLAYSLYKNLFGAIEAELIGVDHLIIAPVGPLLSLPLGILITGRPPLGENYVKAEWLGTKFGISVTPSVRSFADLRRLAQDGVKAASLSSRAAGRTQRASMLAFGNAPFRGDDSGLGSLERFCSTGGPVPSALIRGLAPLPETAEEVEKIGRILGARDSDLLLGAAAREEALHDRDLRDYRILYFATHGLLPGELRCQSEPALALAPPSQDASTIATDGLLTATEITQLSLDAELVVLSACNTASGNSTQGGEALSGLVRSFFYAGARSMLVSHWQVDSASTTSLMVQAFGNLGRGDVSYANGMRKSMRILSRQPNRTHPWFWAAFSFIGDGGKKPIFPSRLTAS